MTVVNGSTGAFVKSIRVASNAGDMAPPDTATGADQAAPSSTRPERNPVSISPVSYHQQARVSQPAANIVV